MTIKLLAAALFLVAASGSAASMSGQAAPAEGPDYLVRLALHDGNRLVGRPTISVRSGHSALMTVDGDGGYSVRISASPDPSRAETVRVASQVQLRRGSRWVPIASPTISLALGGTASIEAALPAENADPASSRFRMEVTVTTLPPTPPAGS